MSKNVKQSRNRPGVAHSFPGGLDSQISITFGTWRWRGCQPQVPAAFTPRRCSWYSFSLGAESTPGHGKFGRNMSLKNPVTPPEIDPGTVRLVAQRINHYATPRPHLHTGNVSKWVALVYVYFTYWLCKADIYRNMSNVLGDGILNTWVYWKEFFLRKIETLNFVTRIKRL